MDEQTALVLALQLVALFSITGALLVYLLCKIRGVSGVENLENAPGAGKAILVTSADSSLGLQISLHLANRGFRVFAGLKEGASSGSSDDSPSSRVIRAWQKHRESLSYSPNHGALIALPLDVTREDLLHEAVDIIRAHLPAGEDGIWAVLNTSGIAFRGRLDQQDISHWDTMLRINIVGLLRTARKFQGLLRNTKGRILTIGAANQFDNGLVGYCASRFGVEGASASLRQEFDAMGIKVVVLQPTGITPELLFSLPKLNKNQENGDVSVDVGGLLEYQPTILTSNALRILDIAITSRNPNHNYALAPKKNWLKPLDSIKFV